MVTPSVATSASTPRDVLTFLRNGLEAFPAMLAAIEAAEREILLEMYWFDDSPIGLKFVDALARKARAGVKVKVSYDAIGSISADPAMYAPLLDAGGEVREFNPIAPWRTRFTLLRVSQRDHRKILIVDGEVAFCGGLNIGLPWMVKEEGGEDWRDDCVRVQGKVACGFREMFYETWERLGGDKPTDLAKRTAKEVRRDVSTTLQGVAAPTTAVIGHDAWGAQRTIRRVYASRVRRANKRIYLVNSYFLPDPMVRRALEQAARRGVEVRLVVPRVSDVPAVLWAGQSLYRRLLTAGCHIHEYTTGVLHAKSALIDDWATIGSYNLDYVSLRQNLEANLVTTDAHLVAALERSFQTDFAEHCEEIKPEAWATRSVYERLRSRLFYLARKFL